MNHSDAETKQFLESFLRSEDLWLILNGIVAFKRSTKKPNDYLYQERLNKFYQELAGKVTEWLFFRHFHPIFLQEGLTLLNPYQTFTLYRNAHREKRVMDESGFRLNPGIKGVPSPDGLLIKPVPPDERQLLQVVSIVECKNVTTDDETVSRYIREQRAGYTRDNVAHHLRIDDPGHLEMPSRLGRLIHRLVADLPALPLTVSDHLTVLYGVPKDAPSLHVQNIEPKFIPIKTSEIGHFNRLLTEAL